MCILSPLEIHKLCEPQTYLSSQVSFIEINFKFTIELHVFIRR